MLLIVMKRVASGAKTPRPEVTIWTLEASEEDLVFLG